MSSNVCEAALRRFAEKDFAGWSGLPKDCALSDLARLFAFEDDWRGSGRLGEETEADYASVVIPGYEITTRVWLDGERIILMDIEYPEVEAGLVERLGRPEAKLDAYWGTILLEKSEWVHASRGLTLFIKPSDLALLRLAVFSPATIDEYEKRLRLNLRTRRGPAHRAGEVL